MFTRTKVFKKYTEFVFAIFFFHFIEKPVKTNLQRPR